AAPPPHQQLQQPAAAQLRVMPPPEDKAPVVQPADREEVAARQLQLVRDLMADATTAQLTGERDRASRMRERAGDRLKDLLGKFPGTRAADEAEHLLARLGR